MKKNFVHDSSEFVGKELNEMVEFIKERELTQKWFTDEDNTRVDKIRFKPIFPEPLCIPTEVATLKAGKLIKFTSSEDAYGDTMYAPDYGTYGSSLLMSVNGELHPVGVSALDGIVSRAGSGIKGVDNLRVKNPQKLDDNLNNYFIETEGYAFVMVQDEKVRAVNSGRYAICPASKVMDACTEWMTYEYPNSTFVEGYACHDYMCWTIDLEDYTQDVLGNFPELIAHGFTPALQVFLSNTAKSSVSLKPTFKLNGNIMPLSATIDCVHIGKGSASERTMAMVQTVKENFKQVFPNLIASFADINKMSAIPVKNAYNAILRAMKGLKIPKQQGMEAADIFHSIYPDVANAYDCFLCIVDAYSFVARDFPNDYKKQFEIASCIGRAIKIDWKKLGDIDGAFSW